MKLLNLVLLSSILFVNVQAESFSPAAQEKEFSQLQTQVRTLQIDIQKMLGKLKNSFTTKKISITAKDISSIQRTIEQAFNKTQDLFERIAKTKVKDPTVWDDLISLIKNVFPFGKTNIMTELQESVSLVMGPLQNQQDPNQSMQTYLEHNFSNTKINPANNLYEQMGLPANITHDEIVFRYQQAINNPSTPEDIKKAWRQMDYLMRQPVGMYIYNLWLQDKKSFADVVSKLPKKELTDLYQYLNITYRQQVYELLVKLPS